MDTPSIVIIIPAYNEENNISKILKYFEKNFKVIVIDDCSKDQTFNAAKNFNAITIRNEKNLGYEATLEKGIFHAIKLNFDYAITFDADGEHDLNAIINFKNLIDLNYDLILGNRSFTNRLSEKFAKFLFYKTWKIKDPFCGMKAYKLKHVKQIGYFDRYKSVGTDLALTMIKRKLKFINTDITSNKREGRPKFGGVLSGNYKICKAILSSYIHHRLTK